MFARATTLAVLASVLVNASPLDFSQLATNKKIPSYGGLQLTWSDDFNGNAGTLPSSANWIIDTGTSYAGGPAQWGTGEVETYTRNTANVQLTGGSALQITPTLVNGQWQSARIETTQTGFTAAAGKIMRMEARILMPDVRGLSAAQADGYWPAFWALGANFRGNYNNWPGIGEFDIMENVNGQNKVWGTLHCGTNPGGPCDETTGLSNTAACVGSACQGNYHVYSFEIDRSVNPETLRWFVDGQQYLTVTESQVGAATWQNAVYDGHFILLNVAMGGSFPNGVAGTGTPTAATVPNVPMYVDYVAVYNSA
ncbi:Laminin subunit alpha-1 [Agyrium rufum]|nr:Laminin subunit alpha-1 [Agyrium rufum]